MFAIIGALALAQQPPAAALRRRGRGERRARSARHGRRRLRGQPVQLRRHAESAARANTVWLEEMTWMDVRDAMKAGKTTVIISTGGIEPNGPWLVLGKHNYVLHVELRRDRAQAGQRAVRADHHARARRRHRTEDRPHGHGPAR